MVRPDRGQILLLGAIVLAVVILGSVVLLQSTLFALPSGTPSADSTVSDAERVRHSVTADVEGLVREVRLSGTDNYTAALEENLSVYSRHYANMTASGEPTYVNVSLDDAKSRGILLKQTEPDPFNCPGSCPDGNSNDWDLINSSQQSDIVFFKLNITELNSNSEPNPFTVIVSNGTRTWEWRIYNPNPSSNTSRIVQTNVNGSGWNTQCDLPGTGSSEFDMLAGEGACTFPSIGDEVEGPYTLRFENGNNVAEGTYQIGVGDARTVNFDSDQAEPTIVIPAVNIVYERPGTSVNTTILINRTEGVS